MSTFCGGIASSARYVHAWKFRVFIHDGNEIKTGSQKYAIIKTVSVCGKWKWDLWTMEPIKPKRNYLQNDIFLYSHLLRCSTTEFVPRQKFVRCYEREWVTQIDDLLTAVGCPYITNISNKFTTLKWSSSLFAARTEWNRLLQLRQLRIYIFSLSLSALKSTPIAAN